MMKLLTAIVLASIFYSQFVWCRRQVPSVVLDASRPGPCPSDESLQEARSTLTAAVLDTLSLQSVPQCGPGLWRQVFVLNMTDSSQQCPSAWQEYSSPSRSCGRPLGSSAGCDQISLPVDAEYSRVCGRASATASLTPDGFENFGPRDAENYVDGLSVTYSSPIQHIWTFAAVGRIMDNENCPCHGFISFPSVDFVGNNYFCDFNANGVLWDQEGCVFDPLCCTFNSPPWFSTQLPASTSDDIDLRICMDQGVGDENLLVESLELYVQ